MNAIFSMIHWWLPVGIIVVGVVLFIFANRQTATSVRSIALVVVALGVFVGIARFLFDTDQEKCEHLTRKLTKDVLDAVGSGNWNTVKGDLDANTTVDLGGRGPFTVAAGPDDIADKAQKGAEKIGLEMVQVMSLSSTVDPENQIVVSATLASTDKMDLDRPEVSYWEFDWVKRPDGHGFILSKIRLNNVGEGQ